MSEIARHLRRHSTEAEAKLWNLLRSRQFAGCRFRRQHPIGKSVVDFACLEYRLIVEADGGQHVDSSSDIERTQRLEQFGLENRSFLE